jgi:hypothetical protein
MMRPRFPGYDVLDKRNTPSWNEQTRQVIDKRLSEIPPRRFFTPEEWARLAAIADRIVPQSGPADERVPIAPWIDRKLAEGQGDGYRFADMPDMREAWRRGLAAIDEESRLRFGAGFVELMPGRQDDVLHLVQQGMVKSALWHGLPPGKFFTSRLVKDIVTVYYAHPKAWNEIGFGGPASPRGYVRLGFDRRDPWESEERNE